MPRLKLGRCTNFGNCSVADAKQVIQIPEGVDLLCPECRRPLAETTPEPSKQNLLPVLIATLLGLLIVGGGAAWLFTRSGHNETPPNGPSSSSAAPAPANGQPALRIHGSNTIGAQLAPALVEAFLKQDGASGVTTTPAGPDAVNVTATYPGETSPRVVEIQAHGSATAFTDLAGSTADIGMASRKIKDTENQSLASLGDMTSPASEHVLGLDGIAIIVNPANNISQLTIQQLADLFSGTTTSWSGLGGPAGPVKIYARDAKSGTYDTFETLALHGRGLAPNAQRFEDSRALSNAVASDVDGIGFVGLPYIASAKAVAISEAGARPLLPNRLTVATEDYALSRRLYLYTPANQKLFARKFVDFALSKAGQDIVAAQGFIAQNVREEAVASMAGLPDDYRRTITGAQRLSLNFRFRTGSSQLDNKALADIDRVSSFLADLHYTGSNVLLLGFADSTGSPAKNVELSKDRARSVSQQFLQRGVEPGLVTGFGAEMPVAANDKEEGRQKNRRVEIWVKK